MFKIIGITVSYRYDDYLRHCLSNARQLDHWYVVVNESDTPTLLLLKHIPNVTLVYFDFHAGGAKFNKSGGIRKAQEIAHSAHPDAWILLLDSDIVLPDNTHKIINNLDLKPDFLYGAVRKFYLTVEDLENDKPDREEKALGWGFFHLYFDKKKLCMEYSQNAARYDDDFMNQFCSGYEKIAIVPLTVKHLGDEIQNWNGRKTKRFEKQHPQNPEKIEKSEKSEDHLIRIIPRISNR